MDKLGQVEALKRIERCFQAVFDHSSGFIGLMRPTYVLIEINQTVLEFSRLSSSETTRSSLAEAGWWTILKQTQTQLRRKIAHPALKEFICCKVNVLEDYDTTATLNFYVKSINNQSEQVIFFVLGSCDITDNSLTVSDIVLLQLKNIGINVTYVTGVSLANKVASYIAELYSSTLTRNRADLKLYVNNDTDSTPGYYQEVVLIFPMVASDRQKNTGTS
ncbi:hypothetical protein [Nostoc sp. MG11]|uniref:hypothetical protein n=1 Tax=Nostoc sp. MG11 TaxID=2721166 RepID=UPI0018676956|nr:hypothetical protein [Nostoc sp. MG11]